MATKIRVINEIAISVYDDRFIPIYQALGLRIQVERATDIEHNGIEWIAVDRSGGIIARGPERNKVIEAEVKHLEKML